jgi:hypothetical protein
LDLAVGGGVMSGLKSSESEEIGEEGSISDELRFISC